jgi:hypothetical protein
MLPCLATGPTNHALEPLKPGVKINLFFLKVDYVRCLSSNQKLTNRPILKGCVNVGDSTENGHFHILLLMRLQPGTISLESNLTIINTGSLNK